MSNTEKITSTTLYENSFLELITPEDLTEMNALYLISSSTKCRILMIEKHKDDKDFIKNVILNDPSFKVVSFALNFIDNDDDFFIEALKKLYFDSFQYPEIIINKISKQAIIDFLTSEKINDIDSFFQKKMINNVDSDEDLFKIINNPFISIYSKSYTLSKIKSYKLIMSYIDNNYDKIDDYLLNEIITLFKKGIDKRYIIDALSRLCSWELFNRYDFNLLLEELSQKELTHEDIISIISSINTYHDTNERTEIIRTLISVLLVHVDEYSNLKEYINILKNMETSYFYSFNEKLILSKASKNPRLKESFKSLKKRLKKLK